MSRTYWAVKLIKLADRCDNLSDLALNPLVPLDFALTYAAESKMLLEAVRGTTVFLEARMTILIAQIEQVK